MFKTANNDGISRPNSRQKLPFPGNGKLENARKPMLPPSSWQIQDIVSKQVFESTVWELFICTAEILSRRRWLSENLWQTWLTEFGARDVLCRKEESMLKKLWESFRRKRVVGAGGRTLRLAATSAPTCYWNPRTDQREESNLGRALSQFFSTSDIFIFSESWRSFWIECSSVCSRSGSWFNASYSECGRFGIELNEKKWTIFRNTWVQQLWFFVWDVFFLFFPLSLFRSKRKVI